jgi:hypothetical protein
LNKRREKKRGFDPKNKKIEFIKKEDKYFNWSKSGNGKKSVKRTVPLTIIKLFQKKVRY